MLNINNKHLILLWEMIDVAIECLAKISRMRVSLTQYYSLAYFFHQHQ